MPLIILALLIVLVAQIGFWDTLASVLGAIGVIIMMIIVLGLLAWAAATYFWRRARSRF